MILDGMGLGSGEIRGLHEGDSMSRSDESNKSTPIALSATKLGVIDLQNEQRTGQTQKGN